MNRIAFACLTLAIAGAAAGAQVRNTEEGEAVIGLVGQNDTRQIAGVRLSPIGINIGVIVQPLFQNRRLSIAEQISFVPIAHLEREIDQFGVPITSRMQPLVVNNLWGRLSSDVPESSGKTVYFAGAGVSFAITTPRDGTKATPMVGLGLRRWRARQMGFEASLQCGLRRVGRTVCILPVTSAWPFA